MFGCPGCGGAVAYRGEICLCGYRAPDPELARAIKDFGPGGSARRMITGCEECGGEIEHRGQRCQCAAGQRLGPDAAAMQLEMIRDPLWSECDRCSGMLLRGTQCGCGRNTLSGAQAAGQLAARRWPNGETATWEEAMRVLRAKYVP